MAYPDLVGLYAPVMGSGKGEVAKHLLLCHGYVLVKFAGPLKRMTYALLDELGYSGDISEMMIEGHLKEAPIPELGGITTRTLMQTLGTEWGRDTLYPEFWVDIAMQKIDRFRRSGYCVVVDDMRFPNEYEALSAAGAKLVCVQRAGVERTNDHPSEGLLNDRPFHWHIHNDGTLEDLHRSIDLAIERF